MGLVHERKASERQRNLMFERLPLQSHQLNAAAAEIANNSGGAYEPGQDPGRSQFRFFVVANDLDRNAAGRLGARQKLRSILRPPHGSGRKRVDVALRDAADVGEFTKARERRKRLGYGVAVQPPRGIEIAAEPAHRLFLKKRGRSAVEGFIYDKPDRVRANIDDGYRLRAPKPSLCRIIQVSPYAWGADAAAKRRGKFPFSAPPRPERLGLVIK